ncbi:MAG: chaperone modulatory protein CbpM [Halieaceae bacterium]|jgi:chaperone modulatory protein CbpM
MNDIKTTYLSFTEVCLQTGVAEDTVVEIVEQGIMAPIGASPGEWLFSPAMLILTKKAVRLHRDLNVDWAGIALAIELLDEVEQLREKNRYLERRLSRFVDL